MLVLASRSPARAALLTAAGLRFAVSPAQIDERGLEARALGTGAGAGDVARALAEAKALAVAADRPDALVIGADQVLALGSELLHKPADLAATRAQLDRLRGRRHTLWCGVALARAGHILWSDIAEATLTLRRFSPVERDRVLALEGDRVLGAVGGYRLEGPSVQLFERIDGDYFTILGLPLLPLLAALRAHAPHLLEGFT
ncbi:Maf family protein [Devosia sp.]|uniref:Maf family protein n=1 Tax=Devosia sp. TaxID=1871048 RepID=UPI002EF6A5D8